MAEVKRPKGTSQRKRWWSGLYRCRQNRCHSANAGKTVAHGLPGCVFYNRACGPFAISTTRGLGAKSDEGM